MAEADGVEDSLRFYFLGSNWERCVEHVGANPGYDPEGTLIVCDKGWSAAFSIHARKRGPGVGAETAECSRMIDSSCFLGAYT